jgi:hypothetical protein
VFDTKSNGYLKKNRLRRKPLAHGSSETAAVVTTPLATATATVCPLRRLLNPKSTAKSAPKAAAPKSTAKPVQKDTAPEFGSKRTSERKEGKSLKRQQITGEVKKTKSGNTQGHSAPGSRKADAIPPGQRPGSGAAGAPAPPLYSPPPPTGMQMFPILTLIKKKRYLSLTCFPPAHPYYHN